MQANRRVIEDQADEAQERVDELARIRRDFLTQIEISKKQIKWLTAEQADHLTDFLNLTLDAMDSLSAAQRLAERDLIDLDAPYRSGQRPGSY